MLTNSEPRRTGKCGRGSEVSFSGDAFEYKPALSETQMLQAAHIASRFVVSGALAKLIAELAFDRGRLR